MPMQPWTTSSQPSQCCRFNAFHCSIFVCVFACIIVHIQKRILIFICTLRLNKKTYNTNTIIDISANTTNEQTLHTIQKQAILQRLLAHSHASLMQRQVQAIVGTTWLLQDPCKTVTVHHVFHMELDSGPR